MFLASLKHEYALCWLPACLTGVKHCECDTFIVITHLVLFAHANKMFQLLFLCEAVLMWSMATQPKKKVLTCTVKFSSARKKKWRLHVHSLYPPGMWPSRTSDGCRRRSHTMWTAISLAAEIKQGKMLASTHTTKPCTYTRSKSTPPPQFVYMFRFHNVLGAPPFFGTEIFLLLLWQGICTAGQHGSGSCAKEKPFFIVVKHMH